MTAVLEASSVLLASSCHPVLYVGGGCNTPEGANGIARLLSVIPMPVVTSLMGIGSIPSDDPCNVGMVGMHGSVAANRAMYEADVVLACGVRFDDRATGVIRKFCPGAKIIHIDIDAAEINKILPAWHAIVADAESVLPVLAALVASRQTAGHDAGQNQSAADRGEWLVRLQTTHREQGKKDRDQAEESQRKTGLSHPLIFISSIPEMARKAGLDPSRLILATDVGQHQMWSAQYYPVTFPRQFLTSGSLGTMGFGLPTAIGAALANPQKRVVCISGDGSIMMNIQELATLAELGLDVTVIVLDNGALGMVRQQQELLFAKNYSASIFSRSPDLTRIAEAFGIISTEGDAPGWEKIAFGGKGPRFVRCKIDQSINVYPFVPAGKSNVEAVTG